VIYENSINIYADGSSYSRPRVGGLGIRLVTINALGQEEFEDVLLPGYAGATNNQMELRACIEGIKNAMRRPDYDSFTRIDIYSDSLYVINKCRKRVDFHWVKGHSKDKHNKAADKLARQSGRKAINRPLSVVKVRRKVTSKSVEPGCVPMNNQRISIRIITDEYLKLSKLYKYKYEVISKSSPHYGNVDFAFSEIILNAGHSYSIRFNDNNNNASITKVFREIPKK